MTEEARNTDRRGFGWSATPLRTQAIAFVSAGPLKRDEDVWNTVSKDHTPHKQSEAETPRESVKPTEYLPVDAGEVPVKSNTQVQAECEAPAIAEEQNEAQPSKTAIDEPNQAILGVSGSSVATNEATWMRDASPSPSTDSDEEEIIFSGRNGAQQSSRKPIPAPKAEVMKKEGLPSTVSPAQSATTTTTMSRLMISATLGLDSPMETPVTSRSRSQRARGLATEKKDKSALTGKKSKSFGRKYDEDELMQDYIDNMALDDSEDHDGTGEEAAGSLPYRKGFKKTEHFRLFNGDGLENEKVQTKLATKSNNTRAAPDQAIDWDSDDLADFDDLSTTDEEVEDVSQVLRHRTRISGAQYLVIGKDAEASDAKWILQSKLVSESATNEIKIYEEIRQMNIEQAELEDSDESEGDSDEEALQDLVNDIESEDDENARIMKYTSRMTDEQIARALAKQEELGLGSDELIIFDGDIADGSETPNDAFGMGEDFISFSLSKHTSNRGRSKRNQRKRNSFPSAEAFADALDEDPYGAFDIMDFDRPSLRLKKKGRKSDYPFDIEGLEDDDLRDQLVNTWTKDREKKAERKRQREEARLAASLDAADAGDPEIIKARIRQFLVQDVDVLKLSPMEAPVRAAVHRLAKSLKLQSRSEGKEGLGIGRYPVLTKTPRTPHYTIHTVWQIDALMNMRKFFPRNLYKGFKGSRPSGVPKQRRGGGGVMSGVTYRDGEEVAASAPEIGADNRGRAMLEKMGWVAGTGIGAVGNQGSIDPIRHIMKTTKAGLG